MFLTVCKYFCVYWAMENDAHTLSKETWTTERSNCMGSTVWGECASLSMRHLGTQCMGGSCNPGLYSDRKGTVTGLLCTWEGVTILLTISIDQGTWKCYLQECQDLCLWEKVDNGFIAHTCTCICETALKVNVDLNCTHIDTDPSWCHNTYIASLCQNHSTTTRQTRMAWVSIIEKPHKMGNWRGGKTMYVL